MRVVLKTAFCLILILGVMIHPMAFGESIMPWVESCLHRKTVVIVRIRKHLTLRIPSHRFPHLRVVLSKLRQLSKLIVYVNILQVLQLGIRLWGFPFQLHRSWLPFRHHSTHGMMMGRPSCMLQYFRATAWRLCGLLGAFFSAICLFVFSLFAFRRTFPSFNHYCFPLFLKREMPQLLC